VSFLFDLATRSAQVQLARLRAHSLHFIPKNRKRGLRKMLWTIIALMLILWLLGLIGHVGGGLIHLLLVIALVVFVIQLISGRRSVA